MEYVCLRDPITRVAMIGGHVINHERLSAWYNFQAPAYHFWRDNYSGPLVRRVGAWLEDGQSHKLLDCACGSGLFTIGLGLRNPNWDLHGLDASTGLLKIANKQAAARKLTNVTFMEGDVRKLPHPSASFDVVTCAGLFPNIEDKRGALGEMARVLKPGGRFVVVEFDRTSMTWATRLFFKGMIAAYKAVSLVFRRFRFSDRWNVEESTIDAPHFEEDIKSQGFVIKETIREHSHLIFCCQKP